MKMGTGMETVSGEDWPVLSANCVAQFTLDERPIFGCFRPHPFHEKSTAPTSERIGSIRS
jgi:hypothetical protein